MIPLVLAYLATACVMLGLDAVWLGVIAMPIYKAGIGHLMAAAPDLPAAVAFYVMFIAGLMIYGVIPNAGSAGNSAGALRSGALFGFFTYATYDLTNLATLSGWPVQIVVIDIFWGMFISASASMAGAAALRRLRASRAAAA